MTKHLAVWLDQTEARIFQVVPDGAEAVTLAAPPRRLHSKHPKRVNDDGEPRASKRFLREVAKALEDAEEVLVTGPSTTKHEFFKFLHKNEPTLEPRIVGIESITDTSDGGFLHYAQQYFKLSAPMR